MPGATCAVYKCKNSTHLIAKWRKEDCSIHVGKKRKLCGCPAPYALHRFPLKNPNLVRQWCAKINRKNFAPTIASRVCSIHFCDGKPTAINSTPQLLLGYKAKVQIGRNFPVLPKIKFQQKLAEVKQRFKVARAMTCTSTPNKNILGKIDMNGPGTSMSSNVHSDEEETSFGSSHDDTDDAAAQQEYDSSMDPMDQTSSSNNPEMSSESILNLKVENIKYNIALDHNYVKRQGLFVKYVNRETLMSAQWLTEKSCHFYTSLPLKTFKLFCTGMAKSGTLNLNTLAHDDQILMFLSRLRLGLLLQDLAYRFDVSRTTVTKVINFWLPKIARELRHLVALLPDSVIKRTMPESFKKVYPNTTIILDCTEIYIQRPRNLKARSQVWSNYKGHSTFKILVGIAPNGAFMFMSKAYGGRASDKFIITDSGFLDLVEPGMEVMADRGFTIESELSSRGVKLNVPAFTRGLDHLSEKELVRTRRIASVRIHIERAIRRLKTFKIVSSIFPNKSIEKLEATILCCLGLCNLMPPLIKRKPGEKIIAPNVK